MCSHHDLAVAFAWGFAFGVAFLLIGLRMALRAKDHEDSDS